MNASVAKKASQAVRLLMMALTAVLIFSSSMSCCSSPTSRARRAWSTTPVCARHHAANR
ncbi:MAG: hypothetical protein ACLU0O_04185 [Collinsella sp.]